MLLEMAEFIFPPLILFVIIVAPIWVVMHYSTKRKAYAQLTSQDQEELEMLAIAAEKMSERIETLEAILDAETPEWRKRSKETFDHENS